MPLAHHAPRCPIQILERLHALAEITERGVVSTAKHLGLSRPELERESIALSENASRYGRHFA